MCVAVGSQQKSCSVRGAAAGALRSPQLLGTPQPLGAAPGAGAPLRGHAGDTPGLTLIPQGRSALKAPGRPRRRLRLRRSASRRRGWAVPGGAAAAGAAGQRDRPQARPPSRPSQVDARRQPLTCPPLPPLPGGAAAAAPTHKLCWPNFGAGRAGEGPRRAGTSPGAAGGSPWGR